MSPAYAAAVPASTVSPSRTGSLAAAGTMGLNVVTGILMLPLVPVVGLMWASMRLQGTK